MALLRLRPGLKVGDPAPDFDCPDEDGKRWSLAELKGRWLVLFFYPRDNTPICLKEACIFNDDYAEFRGLGAEVLGCSGQDAASHRRFRQACRLQYRLLSDVDGALRRAFKTPDLLGLFPSRTTYLVDPQGVIRFVHDDRAHGDTHPALALKALRQALSAA
jgi:peroxiredoxin Q/BCP